MGHGEGQVYGYMHMPCRSRSTPASAPRSPSRGESLAEFTGERVIPGQVDDDLWNEHYSRYPSRPASRAQARARCRLWRGLRHAELARWRRSRSHRHRRQRRSHRLRHANTTSATQPPLPARLRRRTLPFPTRLRSGRRLRSHRTPRGLGEVAHRSPPRARARRPVHRLHAEQALLRRNPRQSGPNPFHVHEFEIEEFRAALAAVFPHVSLFLENHAESIIVPARIRSERPAEVRVDGARATAPAESHFFLAVCANEIQTGSAGISSTSRAPLTCSASANATSNCSTANSDEGRLAPERANCQGRATPRSRSNRRRD
jgi:hypothetical protein